MNEAAVQKLWADATAFSVSSLSSSSRSPPPPPASLAARIAKLELELEEDSGENRQELRGKLKHLYEKRRDAEKEIGRERERAQGDDFGYTREIFQLRKQIAGTSDSSEREVLVRRVMELEKGEAAARRFQEARGGRGGGGGRRRVEENEEQRNQREVAVEKEEMTLGMSIRSKTKKPVMVSGEL